MTETRRRSLVKSIVWEIAGIILTTILLYGFRHYNWIIQSLVFVVIYRPIRFGLYYLHERLWSRINWGKT